MSKLPIIVAPSILACDFSQLGAEVERIDQEGSDWIHCDVMDGHFVNNISFGPAFVQTASKHTQKPIDVHLMIERPDLYIERFFEFSHSITSHIEASHDVTETLHRVRKAKCLAGLAISPPTSIDQIIPFLGKFDILLIMTVNPGFGGQAFLTDMINKVREAAALRNTHGLDFHIEVDGGINPETAHECRIAGANIMVAGTSVFKAKDRRSEIQALRALP